MLVTTSRAITNHFLFGARGAVPPANSDPPMRQDDHKALIEGKVETFKV